MGDESAEEPLALGDDDEPKAYELLNDDEAAAKRKVWMEVNKEVFHFQALQAKRKRATELRTEERRRMRSQQFDDAIWARTQRCRRQPGPQPRSAVARTDLAR